MKVLKLIIIIILIFIICIAGIMFIISSKYQTKNDVANTDISINTLKNEITNTSTSNQSVNIVDKKQELEYAPELSFNTKIQEINSYSDLYNISNNITKYYNFMKVNNESAINELGGIMPYNILEDIKYIAKNAFVTSNQYQSKYYVEGSLIQFAENYIVSEQKVYILMYVDLENNTYRISEIEINKFRNMEELKEEEDIYIPIGNYNNYEYTYIDGAKQLEIYIKDYVFYLQRDINKAYDMLEEEYKLRRFRDMNDFKDYVTKNLYRLQNVRLIQYNITNDNEITNYVGTDENGNYYKVIEESYMNYNIILDDYTIVSNYDNLDKKEKIKLNVERFISMLNAKDYQNAYKVLEPKFKENNFQTQEDFENYVKREFFNRNIISSKEMTEEEICIVNMRETLSTKSNKKEKSFKVTLLEEGFYIEFDI